MVNVAIYSIHGSYGVLVHYDMFANLDDLRIPHDLPSGYVKIAIENCPVEIVELAHEKIVICSIVL